MKLCATRNTLFYLPRAELSTGTPLIFEPVGRKSAAHSANVRVNTAHTFGGMRCAFPPYTTRERNGIGRRSLSILDRWAQNRV